MANPKETLILSLGTALLAMLGEAEPTGLLNSDARLALEPIATRRRDDDKNDQELMMRAPTRAEPLMLAGHRSHSSHSSHYSGGGYGGRRGGGYVPDSSYFPPASPPAADEPASPVLPKSAHVKPAVISIVASPGGHIYVDGKLVGRDSTQPLTLKPGKHSIRVENRFVGSTSLEIKLAAGQTGSVDVKW